MPGKSQRKHISQSKKRKRKRGSSAIAVQQQQPVSQTYEPVSEPVVSAPPASEPALKAIETAAQYPYIVNELRRIGILTGIMLAILVVLALVLP
jgi:hypothetical protein